LRVFEYTGEEELGDVKEDEETPEPVKPIKTVTGITVIPDP
jgi:hypothetical protein